MQKIDRSHEKLDKGTSLLLENDFILMFIGICHAKIIQILVVPTMNTQKMQEPQNMFLKHLDHFQPVGSHLLSKTLPKLVLIFKLSVE